jgi:hypothetical protein
MSATKLAAGGNPLNRRKKIMQMILLDFFRCGFFHKEITGLRAAKIGAQLGRLKTPRNPGFRGKSGRTIGPPAS